MGSDPSLATKSKRQEEPEALWPGDCRPGLYLHLLCKFSHILRHLIALEVRDGRGEPCAQPSIFDYGRAWLGKDEQLASRELYWEVISGLTLKKDQDVAIAKLQECIRINPFIGEPHILLAQILISRSQFEEAERHAAEGVKLLCEWTTVWDKRMSWEGWIAWGRVIVQNSREKTWPKTAFGVIGLGLVQ